MKVCSDKTRIKREFERISEAIADNGYPKRFTERAINKQMKKGLARRVDEADPPKWETARIPYIDGLSQEVRRIARTAGVRCAFYLPIKLCSLYQAKDALPLEATTHAVYSVTCKTCSAEYIGETQRALRVRRNEHRDAVRLGHCSKSAVAEHVHDHDVPHEVDWNSLKVLDKSKKLCRTQSSRGIPYLAAPTADEQGWRCGKKRNVERHSLDVQ